MKDHSRKDWVPLLVDALGEKADKEYDYAVPVEDIEKQMEALGMVLLPIDAFEELERFIGSMRLVPMCRADEPYCRYQHLILPGGTTMFSFKSPGAKREET